MTAWFVILGVSLGTYLLRVSMFVLLAERGLPQWAERRMAVVGPAAIAALVAWLSFTEGGSLRAAPAAELVALAVAFVAVRRTGNVMWAFGAGLPAFWAAGALV